MRRLVDLPINKSMRYTKKAFTLIELLTVIGIVALLIAVLIPSLAIARERSKILVVNAELSNIGLALEAYAMQNKGVYPPTRADCNEETRKHWWALPRELAEQNYLPKGTQGLAVFSSIEDKFNRGCTYKYVAVGKRLDYTGSPGTQRLMIPQGFPLSVPEPYRYISYSDPAKSPVTWCLFSVGPRFDENNSVRDGFPVDKKFWFSSQKKSGIIMRLRTRKGEFLGSFEGNP